LIPRYWAQQKKVNDLKLFKGKYKEELLKLGQTYGFVTDGASLIVLQSIDEYFRYGVVPDPDALPELAKSFAERKQRELDNEQQRIKDKLTNVYSKWNARMSWYEQEFPIPPTPQELKKKQELDDIGNELNSTRNITAENDRITNERVQQINTEFESWKIKRELERNPKEEEKKKKNN